MYVSKKMLILLVFVYCLNILLSAGTNKDETWPDLFSGEETDIWIVVKDLDGGPHEYKATLYDERLFDPDNDFHVKWWLRQSFKDGYGKYRYDKEIADTLYKVLRQIAWKVQEKIDNCQVLQNMYGDKIKGKKKYPLSFQYYKNNACGDTMSISVRMSNLLLHKILKDIGEQLRNGAEEIQVDVSKYTCNGNDILDVWGHETLHAITGAGEPSEVDECFVHCLTKKCIAENPDDYVLKNFQTNQGGNIKCNEITDQQWEYLIDRTGDVDPREEMKAGDCFCDEKWTKDAECDENNPGPPIPEWGNEDSSGTTRTVTAYLPDPPDDHYSYSDFAAFSDNDINTNSGGTFLEDTVNDYINFSFYPDILIYNKYGTSLMGNLLNRIMPGNYIDDYTHDYFSTNHKILVIPSAALIGDSESEIVKQAIMKFLEGDRSVFLLSQQFGSDVENLILSLTWEKIITKIVAADEFYSG